MCSCYTVIFINKSKLPLIGCAKSCSATFHGGRNISNCDRDWETATYNISNLVNQNYTWMAWAKGEQISTSGHYMPDIGYGSGAWPRAGFREMQGSGWEWRSYSSGGSTTVHNMTLVSSPTPTDWVCLGFAADYDNTQTKGYYNGEHVATNSSYPDISGNTNTFGLGRAGDTYTGWNEVFEGSMSLAMIYNRVLTDAEVKQNYNAIRSRYGL